MQILGDPTVQARTIVKPPKPQPKKIAPAPVQVSENGQAGPVAVLPSTPVKKVAPPPAKPAAQPQASSPADGGFSQFFQNLYPTPPPIDTQAVQQPYLDEYNKELALLGQGQQTENTFDTKLAGELQSLLSSNGIDPGFAKSLQAALQLEALRNSGNTYATAQGRLTDNFFGANGIIPGALSSAQDAYNKSLPTGDQELSAWTAYNDQINKQNSTQLAAQTASQKAALANRSEQWKEAYQTAVLRGKSASQAQTFANNATKNNLAQQKINLTAQKNAVSAQMAKANLSLKQYSTLKSLSLKQLNTQIAQGHLTIAQKNAVLAQKKYQLAVKKQAQQASTKGGTTGVAAQFPNLTKSQVLHLRAGAANAYKGWTNTKNNKTFPPATYQQAIDDLVAGGYSRAGATKMVNRFYTHPWQRTGGWTYGKPGPVGG